MVSDPPPAKSRALMFGMFVLFVAVVTFVTLYFIKPFDQDDPRPASGTPAGDEVQPAPAGTGSTGSAGPAADTTAPDETNTRRSIVRASRSRASGSAVTHSSSPGCSDDHTGLPLDARWSTASTCPPTDMAAARAP